MSTRLPSAKALMTHADDPRHIIYATWVNPLFFPYMRDLLNELLIRVLKQPAQEKHARSFMDTFAQSSNTGYPCLILTEKLRSTFKVFDKEKERLGADNSAWVAVSAAMIYFVLVTDFHFAAPMSNQTKTNHLSQLRLLNFAGPRLPAHFLQ